jgi:lysophospholipase L1-like esterase
MCADRRTGAMCASMRDYLPELIALLLMPILLVQGRRTRSLTPRLPAARGPTCGTSGTASTRPALKLLVLGESPAAGVGVRTHQEAITGQLANALAARLKRQVAWQAVGGNGLTVREALDQLLPVIAPDSIDLVLVAFGVNDTVAFRPAARWRADLAALLDALEARCHPHLVLLSGVPPIGRFPALPQPLRWVLGLKASTLDRSAQKLGQSRPGVLYVPLALDGRASGFMAHDGYHPSAAGCAAWAEMLAMAYCSRPCPKCPPAVVI